MARFGEGHISTDEHRDGHVRSSGTNTMGDGVMLDLLKPMLLLEILTKAMLSKSSTHNVTSYASTEGERMRSTHGIANELLRQPGIQAKVDPAGRLPRRWAW